jgi:RNA polymerase sigma-70 factor, ECF subfamily
LALSVLSPDATKLAQFEQIVMPHLNAAYNLARWLMRNEHDAEDVVQEAYLRAFRFFDGFQGGDGRGWLLAIVRNSCRTLLRQSGGRESAAEFDEQMHSARAPGSDPEERMLRQTGIDSVRHCIDGLPAEYREVIVLRELEEMSYKEIAEAASVPLGTVMSRLARARARLQDCLSLHSRRPGEVRA